MTDQLIENNKERPPMNGLYMVIHSDHALGYEWFVDNCWRVKYNHPVAYWFYIQEFNLN